MENSWQFVIVFIENKYHKKVLSVCNFFTLGTFSIFKKSQMTKSVLDRTVNCLEPQVLS